MKLRTDLENSGAPEIAGSNPVYTTNPDSIQAAGNSGFRVLASGAAVSPPAPQSTRVFRRDTTLETSPAACSRISNAGNKAPQALRQWQLRQALRQAFELEITTAVAPETTEKKPFVVPKITAPVDVLEATTFFQSVESGATN